MKKKNYLCNYSEHQHYNPKDAQACKNKDYKLKKKEMRKK